MHHSTEGSVSMGNMCNIRQDPSLSLNNSKLSGWQSASVTLMKSKRHRLLLFNIALKKVQLKGRDNTYILEQHVRC